MMNEDRAFSLSTTPTGGRYIAYDTLNINKQRKRVERLLGKMQRRRILGSPRPVDTLRNHPHQSKWARKRPKAWRSRLTAAQWREEAPSKRVGRVETQSGVTLTCNTVCGRVGCHRSREERGADPTPGAEDPLWEDKCPYHLALKSGGA